MTFWELSAKTLGQSGVNMGDELVLEVLYESTRGNIFTQDNLADIKALEDDIRGDSKYISARTSAASPLFHCHEGAHTVRPNTHHSLADMNWNSNSRALR